MNTAELKNILKLRIDFINDKKFLSALNTLIESKKENIIVLTKEQKEIINQSQKEYSKGNFYTNDVVNEEMEKWLVQ
jgi:beta-glucosidase/6-phospho-beta-glucosidase/beta-galactosidase